MNARAAYLAFALPLVWACSTGAGQAGRTTPRHDANLITAEELAAANASNLFDAIRQLRPMWMEPGLPTAFRATSGQSEMMVYVNRVREGGTDALRSIPLLLVESVRFLTASQAQAEFGLDNLHGAIQVITRRAR
jgi:hypothetical protein